MSGLSRCILAASLAAVVSCGTSDRLPGFYYAEFEVSPEPATARIYSSDGREFCSDKAGPCRVYIQRSPEQPCQLTLTATARGHLRTTRTFEGECTYDSERAAEAHLRKVELNLDPAYFHLKIYSDPEGAYIYGPDGNEWGVTTRSAPVERVFQGFWGDFTIAAVKRGYKKTSHTLVVKCQYGSK